MPMTPIEWANFALVIWPMVERLIALIEGLIKASKSGESKKGLVMSAIATATGGRMTIDDIKAVGAIVDQKVADYNATGWPVT